MLDDLKRESWHANMLLHENGLVPLTFGNASVLDRAKGIFAIKPSGVPYAGLTPGQMVLVDLQGRKVEGDLEPSSDMPTHLELYLGFPGIASVAHTHSRFATSFAQAGKPVPCLGTTHADYFRGDIPVTRMLSGGEIEGHYERETGHVILERFDGLDPLEVPGVLVRAHGAFGWGLSGEKAAEILFVMELAAEMAFYALQINPEAKPVPPVLRERHFRRKHGGDAYYGQNAKAASALPARRK